MGDEVNQPQLVDQHTLVLLARSSGRCVGSIPSPPSDTAPQWTYARQLDDALPRVDLEKYGAQRAKILREIESLRDDSCGAQAGLLRHKIWGGFIVHDDNIDSYHGSGSGFRCVYPHCTHPSATDPINDI